MRALQALIDPIDGMPAGVAARRWVLPLLLLMASVAGSGAAFALRWDAGPSVIARLQAAGELQDTTEQEIAEQISMARRVRLVQGVALGVFLVPLGVLLLACGLKLCGWLFERPAKMVRCLSAASLGLLPLALYHAVRTACALNRTVLADGDGPGLVPSTLAALFPHVRPPLERVLAGVDYFGLWCALLLGLGFAAASGMRRHRAVLLLFTLYAVQIGVVQAGLPGLLGGR